MDFGFGSGEGAGGLVVALDEGIDVLPELGHSGEAGALEGLSAEDREPAFDLVEPGGVGRREVKMDVGMARKPAVVAALPETPPLPPVRNAAGAADEDIKLIAGASPILGLQFAPWSQTSPGPQFSDFSMKLALRR